jgi:hypothetical protein
MKPTTTKVPVHASVVEAPKGALADVRVAMEQAGPPLLTDGNPTLTFMEAWLCHEGVNANRLAFLADDFDAAVARISPTSPIVMDFNHSAVSGFSWDPPCIGVWYSAEKAFDPDAQDGAGAWGIRAKGVMFAWLFPTLADLVLAEQARKGYVEFSMACIAGRTDTGYDAQGTYEVAREPVFFTLSLLDVPPADADARGTVTEGGSTPDSQNTREVACAQRAAVPGIDSAAHQEETQMNEELKALLAALEGRLQEQFAEAVNGLLGAHRSEVDLLQVKLDEAETAQAVALERVDTLQAEVAKLVADFEAATLVIAEFEAAEQAREVEVAAEAKRARLAARIQALPETVRKAHEGRTDERRARLEAKWSDIEEADWELYVQDELLAGLPATHTASSAVSYLERSEREGLLPITSGDAHNPDWSTRIARHLIK